MPIDGERCNDCGCNIPMTATAYLDQGQVVCQWCLKARELGLKEQRFCGCCHVLIPEGEELHVHNNVTVCGSCAPREDLIRLMQVDDNGEVEPVDGEMWDIASGMADQWMSEHDTDT